VKSLRRLDHVAVVVESSGNVGDDALLVDLVELLERGRLP
jgi:hypothetical protein